MELRIKNLRKEIAGREILKDINLHLKKGAALGLRGVNGSGKTTLLRLVSGLDKAYHGEIFLSPELKKRIGYISQDLVLFEDYTVFDNLILFATRIKIGRERKRKIEELAGLLGFKDLLNKRVNTLSGGQKRLVHIALGLIGEPFFIFLDEAIVGLDCDKIQLVENYLLSKRSDCLMILTSHQDDFLQGVCNCFATLKGGELFIDDEDS